MPPLTDETQDFFDTVLVVIVLYLQQPADSIAWNTLREEETSPAAVLFYDNSPKISELPVSGKISIHYHHNPGNPGVGMAYNFANGLAMEMGKKWLMLLDQDTGIAKGTLIQYAHAVREYSASVLFAPSLRDEAGLVSPFIFRFAGGVRLPAIPSRSLSLKKFSVINSGLLIQCNAFARSGGYPENIRADFSDLAFLKKFRSIQDYVIIIPAELSHSLSATKSKSAFDEMERFTNYCRDAKVMAMLFGKKWMYIVRSFIRSLRLSIRHREFGFLKVHWQTWLG